MRNRLNSKRILAIDPTSRGFGFAVLEGTETLIDWGIVRGGSGETEKRLTSSEELMDRYLPQVIVLEDLTNHSRRSLCARKFLFAVADSAKLRRIHCHCIPREKVQQSFAIDGRITKHQIAGLVAKHFRELKPRIPKPRKPWTSEAEGMAIFDAVALALTSIGWQTP